jgi:CBS domain-containing protein
MEAAMNIATIMTKAVVTVMPGHSIRHAAQIMLDHHVSGLPVVDDDSRLVGILTESDLLRRIEFAVVEPPADWAPANSSEGAARSFVKSHSWRVGDVMSKPAVTVTEGTSIAEAAQLLRTRGIKRLPVVRDGELVGVVSRADLLRIVASSRPEIVTGGDEAIKISAQAYLRDVGALLSRQPEVTVEHGIVHLWGSVNSQAERDAARVAVERVHGIDGVEDHLTVTASG